MPLTPIEANAAVVKLYTQLAKRKVDSALLERYYRGEQPLAYASEQWRAQHADRYKNFCDNWTGVVANSPAERLRVSGFTLPTPEGEADSLTASERGLWEWWQRNDLDLQSSQGFLGAIISRRSYAMVWGNVDGEPLITWEDASEVIVWRDPANRRKIVMGLKTWDQDEHTECATLYTADEVWKFQRRSFHRYTGGSTPGGLIVATTLVGGQGGWEPRHPPEDSSWPMANPLGEVPLVEFENRPMLKGEPMSDISGTVAMQDAINLLWAYLFAAADHASFPARVIMGQEPPMLPVLDDQGNKIGEKPVKMEDLANGRFLWLTGQNTKIDSWNAAALDVFTGVVEIAVGHIAAQTRTPPHYLVANKGMSNLSGDALKAAETGLVKKVEEQQLFFGPSVRDIFRLSAKVLGEEGLAQAASRGDTQWRDAESRSESQLVDALQKLQAIGFPFAWIAARYGLSATEVASLISMKQAETDSNLLGSAASVLEGLKTNNTVPAPPAPAAVTA